MKSFVFDSSALISYLDGESNAYAVSEVFEEISKNESKAYLSVINLGEIYYHFLRTGGEKTAMVAFSSINKLPLIIEDVNLEMTLKAAKIKAFNKMSYADCFAAALTEFYNAILVTSDMEFKQVESKIKIYRV